MPNASWTVRPVFVTSTFRDMHAERDYLRTHVLPELAERLQERRCHLEAIDLRWGVATSLEREAEAKELLVLKVCLAEVERSRPFLIAILGDRYGWVPPSDRMAAAAAEAGIPGSVGGKSITDLEIDFGVLSDLNRRNRCFFYFREPLPYGEMDCDDARVYSDRHDPNAPPSSVKKLAALKKRIESALPDRVRRYRATWDAQRRAVRGLEDWGKQVLEDLWSELEVETQGFASASALTWQEAERRSLQAFVERHRLDYAETDELDQAFEHAMSFDEDGAWGLCISGESGQGKSALFSALVRRLLEEPVVLLQHSAAVTPESSYVDRMLARWTEELQAVEGITPCSDADLAASDPVVEFAALLEQVSLTHRVVLVIDGLTDFTSPDAKYFSWFPDSPPSNVRCVVTSRPGVEIRAFESKSGTKAIVMGWLNDDQSRKIITSICARYHRTPDEPLITALAQKPARRWRTPGTDPLWLTIAVEELNLLDADDFRRADEELTGTAEDRLQRLVGELIEEMPADVGELYAWLLKRAEQTFGSVTVRAFTSLIAASYSGLRDSDFRYLMPVLTSRRWDTLEFAALRRRFRAHLLPIGEFGQWDFTHAQMKQAVSQVYLGDPNQLKLHRAEIATHLASLADDDPLRESDLFAHLASSEDPGGVARFYGSELTVKEASGVNDFLKNLIVKTTTRKSDPGARWVAKLLDEPRLTHAETHRVCRRILYDLLPAVQNYTRHAARATLLQAVETNLSIVTLAEPTEVVWLMDLANARVALGDEQRANGEAQGAQALFEAALALVQAQVSTDPSSAAWQRTLSLIHDRLATSLLEEGDLKAARVSQQACLAITKGLVGSNVNDNLLQEDLAVSHLKLGTIQQAQGDLEAAARSAEAALAIRRKLAAGGPRDESKSPGLLECHQQFGDIQFAKGELKDARESFEIARDMAQRLWDSNPEHIDNIQNLLTTRQKVGDIEAAEGNLEAASEVYDTSYGMLSQLREDDPTNPLWQTGLAETLWRQASVLEAKGDSFGAQLVHRTSRSVSRGEDIKPLSLARDSDFRPVPLRPDPKIGVTGHRLIADVDAVTAGVEQALDAIEGALPFGPLPIISSLAGGAERLVVQRALRRDRLQTLIVTLPRPHDDYLRDFDTEASVAEFEALLDRATRMEVMTPGGSSVDGHEAAAESMLAETQVLIAVWDGQPPTSKTGTAATVFRARELGIPIAWIHAGNRMPGTMQPLSLGTEQGMVSFERFDEI